MSSQNVVYSENCTTFPKRNGPNPEIFEPFIQNQLRHRAICMENSKIISTNWKSFSFTNNITAVRFGIPFPTTVTRLINKSFQIPSIISWSNNCDTASTINFTIINFVIYRATNIMSSTTEKSTLQLYNTF